MPGRATYGGVYSASSSARPALLRDRRRQPRQRAVAELQALPKQNAGLYGHERVIVGSGPKTHLRDGFVIPAKLAQTAFGSADLVGGEAPERHAAQHVGVGGPFGEARRRGGEQSVRQIADQMDGERRAFDQAAQSGVGRRIERRREEARQLAGRGFRD